jgi:BirA family biotin operon repressor/biotin-[acetyl-CoA-carboxylase] ligase
MDRTFEAPKSSALLFSLYITPTRDRGDWGFITHLAALTMQQVISVDLLSQVSLKWPNDILIGDAKVAGLLAQAAGEGIILGIGINVSMTEDELPVSSATSLAIAGSSNLNRNLILSNFLMLFESNFKKWDEGQDFIESYSRNCSTIGQNVRVEVAGRESRTGKALAINQTGALILEDGFEVNVGDVVHLR